MLDDDANASIIVHLGMLSAAIVDSVGDGVRVAASAAWSR